MRVLVAEDHERLARSVAAGLRRYGMTVDVALDGDDALARLGVNRYDVVILDRVQALGRRPGAPKINSLGFGDVQLDPVKRVATRAGRTLALRPKEFAVLECLLAAGGKPVSAEELLERVWDSMTDPFTTTVKATVNRLRAKLGQPSIIDTVRDSGYRIGGP